MSTYGRVATHQLSISVKYTYIYSHDDTLNPVDYPV